MAEKFSTGWRQVAACMILLSVTGVMAAAYTVVAVPLAAEFKPSRMVLMLAMTLMSLVGALTSPFIGMLMDRVSLRRLMFIGVGLLAGGYVALSFATSFPQVLAVYALLMAPANILIGPVMVTVLISRWFVKKRGRAIGLAVAGIAIGTFIFPPLIQLLLDSYDWRVAFRVLAVIAGLITLFASLMIVDHPAERGLHADGESSEQGLASAAAEKARMLSGPPITTRMVFTDPAFWCAVIVFSVVLSGMKGMVTNLMPLAVDKGIDASVAAFLLSIYAAAGMAAKFGFAAFADRINLRGLIWMALAGFTTGMIFMSQAHLGYGVIAVGVACVGLFGGMVVPLEGLLVPRFYGRHVTGKVSGLLNLFTLAALLSTPPLFGFIFDVTGKYDAIFIVFAGIAAAAMLLVRFIRVTEYVAPEAAEDATETPATADGLLVEGTGR